MNRSANAHRIQLLNPAPWPTRARLAAISRADRIGCWLATHSGRAAEWWWRALRMW